MLLVSAAWADPVLHPGVDWDDARPRAAWAAGAPPETLTAVPVPEEWISGSASYFPCSGPPADTGAVSFLLDRAEAALSWDRRDAALEQLTSAEERIGCHPAPEAGLLARYHALMGVWTALNTSDRAALSHFAQARVADPQIAWQEGWPVVPELLDRVLASAEASELTVIGDEIVLDGLPIEGTNTMWPGRYHLHTPRGTGWLELRAGRALVFDDRLLAGQAFADPTIREPVSALLAWHLGTGTPTWLVTTESVWSFPAGEPGWVERETLRPSRWIRRGLLIAGMGGAIALGSGLPALAAVGRARDASDAIGSAGSTAAWTEATADYDTASHAVRRWRTISVAGGGVSAVGIGISVVAVAGGPRSTRPRAED